MNFEKTLFVQSGQSEGFCLKGWQSWRPIPIFFYLKNQTSDDAAAAAACFAAVPPPPPALFPGAPMEGGTRTSSPTRRRATSGFRGRCAEKHNPPKTISIGNTSEPTIDFQRTY